MNKGHISDGQNITFKITGEEMDNGYNLYYVCQALSDFHAIIDKSYLVLGNKRKMSEKERRILNIRLTTVNKGSFNADLIIQILATTQMALPFVISLNPLNVWELFKQAYDYLIFVLEGFFSGESVSIEGGEKNMIAIIKGGSNNSINIFPQARDLAVSAYQDYQSLLSGIGEEKGIDQIYILNKTNNTHVGMNQADKELFETPSKINEELIEIQAEIFRVDGHSLTGRLKVLGTLDNDIIIGAEYNGPRKLDTKV